MRKIILTLCVLLAGTTALRAQSNAKFGHIDRQALMLMLPERKAAETAKSSESCSVWQTHRK